MESLKYIFAQPDYIDGVGNIYPIKLKDYDMFQKYSSLLYVSKAHFQDEQYPLLVLLFLARESLGLQYEELTYNLSQLFSLVCKSKFRFVSEDGFEGFINEEGKIITVYNYDDVRKVIMKQNLMFEQKIYKNPIIQEWAMKVLMSRQKNSAKITIEDFITTVKNYDGLTYDQIMEQSIYQLYADFYRIGKMMQFEQSSLFATVSTEPISIQHFAESIDMFKSPYDDLFVSSDKLNKLNMVSK